MTHKDFDCYDVFHKWDTAKGKVTGLVLRFADGEGNEQSFYIPSWLLQQAMQIVRDEEP